MPLQGFGQGPRLDVVKAGLLAVDDDPCALAYLGRLERVLLLLVGECDLSRGEINGYDRRLNGLGLFDLRFLRFGRAADDDLNHCRIIDPKAQSGFSPGEIDPIAKLPKRSLG